MSQPQATPAPTLLAEGQAILVIDTASRPGYLALCIQPGLPPRQHPFTHFRRQSEELFPLLQALLSESSLALNDLRAVVVATGPGSFSAMRVGLTAAKSLAETSELPLVGISLLDAASDHCPNEHRLVLLPASRNQWFAAGYNEANQPVFDPQVDSLEELAGLLARNDPAPTTIISSGDLSVIDLLCKTAASLRVEDCEPNLGTYFQQRAWARVQASDWDDPLTLDALYVRREDADGSWTDRNHHSNTVPLSGA